MLKKKKQIETKAAKKKEAKLDQLITEKEAEATCSTEILKSSEPKLEICYDYAKLENLKFGRLSFGGFNKEVEVKFRKLAKKKTINQEISSFSWNITKNCKMECFPTAMTTEWTSTTRKWRNRRDFELEIREIE